MTVLSTTDFNGGLTFLVGLFCFGALACWSLWLLFGGNSPVPCTHDHLTFGSGGFYVFCRDCSAAWVARKGANDEIDYTRSNDGLTTADFRDKPKKD